MQNPPFKEIYTMARKGLKAATAVINGKRKWFYAKTKKEAARRAQEAIAANIHHAPDGDIIYSDWLKKYLALTADHVTMATMESYKFIFNCYVIPKFGSYRLCDLNHIEIREYLSEMLSKGLSPRTVNYTQTMLKSSLKQAVEDGLLAANPMDKVKKVKQPRSNARAIITVEEFRRLLDAAHSDEIRRLMSIALSTGLRREEILGLRWDDIDLPHRRLTVNQTVIRLNNQAHISPLTKTNSSRRTITIDRRTCEDLQEQFAFDVNKRDTADGYYLDSGLVFCNSAGGAIRPEVITRAITAAAKRAGLPPGVTYYSFRHTHATMLLSAGVNIKIIQARLGHASISTTLNTYAHVMANDEEQAAGAIEKLLK